MMKKNVCSYSKFSFKMEHFSIKTRMTTTFKAQLYKLDKFANQLLTISSPPPYIFKIENKGKVIFENERKRTLG